MRGDERVSERWVGRFVSASSARGSSVRSAGPGEAAVRLVESATRGPAVYELVDSIEEVRLPVSVEGTRPTRGGVVAEQVDDADRFPAPVDGCWRVRADAVKPLCTADVYVRAPDNSVVATATAETPARVPEGPHVLELSTAPVKTYVRVVGPARVSYEDRYPHVSVDVEEGERPGDDHLLIAARSRRTSPAGTITVPEGPAGIARAISTFGSALATTSPERSFPTLRGHPPLLERGETFSAPRFVDTPDTGVTLGLPFEYGPLFAATPLAFYLAAGVEESADPYLRAGGVRRDLPSDPEPLATALGDVLRHCFTLDCATRACAVGLYDVDLHVHKVLTERLDPPWTEWYEADLAERTGRYLEVPTAATLDCLDWPFTTDVVPVAENASVLPYLAADLSVVRSPPGSSPATPSPDENDVVPELDGFVRGAGERHQSAPPSNEDGGMDEDTDDGAVAVTAVDVPVDADRRTAEGPAGDDSTSLAIPSTRGATQNARDDSEEVVTPRDADSIAQSWVGPGFPMRAAKPTNASFRRRLDHTPAEDLTIGVTIVCNDDAMAEELGDTYGFRDHVVFDIREEHDLSVDELRTLLAEEHEFFHFVGHVDERGMSCTDGFLDLRTVESTGVEAFLLNACSSYRQGMALVEAGALGGVVSLTDLPNSLATRVGRDLARLFDAGFPLYAALDVVGTGPFAGNAYSIVGDPMVQLCQCANGAAMVIRVEETERGDRTFEPVYYPTRRFGIGTMANPYFGNSGMRFVAAGRTEPLLMSDSAIENFLEEAHSPFVVASEIYWPQQLGMECFDEITDPL